MHIEEHGARGVADVGGMHCAMRELPDQPAVHRAKGQLAVVSLLACAGDVVQQPFEFGSRKIGIDQQAGFGLDGFGQATLAQLGAYRLGAAVLPDDGMVDGQAGSAVPDDRRLTLVGDAHGMNIAGAEPGL